MHDCISMVTTFSFRRIQRLLGFIDLRSLWVLLAMVALTVATGISQAAEVFGTIELVEGSVRIIDARGQIRLPHVDDKISEGDTVVTGRDGEMHVRSEDHAIVAIRANTKFRIDAYLAQGEANDKTAFSLLEGAIRSITGWIGKLNPQAYSIKTPSVTLGIRGTDHETSVVLPSEPGQTQLAPAGTYDKVNTGSTIMQSDKGSIVLKPNEAGFAEHEGKTEPRRLDAIPALYKPTKNEQRIEDRKEALKKEMDTHRTARQKEAEEKKKQLQRHLPAPKLKVNR